MAHASFSRTGTRPRPAPATAASCDDSTLPHFRPKPQRPPEAQPTPLPACAIDSAAAVMASAPRLLKPKDVAERLAVTERTLERWRASGEGPAFLSLTRATVRYTSEAVDAFLQTRVRASTARR